MCNHFSATSARNGTASSFLVRVVPAPVRGRSHWRASPKSTLQKPETCFGTVPRILPPLQQRFIRPCLSTPALVPLSFPQVQTPHGHHAPPRRGKPNNSQHRAQRRRDAPLHLRKAGGITQAAESQHSRVTRECAFATGRVDETRRVYASNARPREAAKT